MDERGKDEAEMAHAMAEMNRAMEAAARAACPFGLQISTRFSSYQLHRLLVSLADFLGNVRLVLHDDWEYTEAHIQGNASSRAPSIHPDGTFLEPGGSDESNNWGNRGALLRSYRELIQHLGFIPTGTMSFTAEEQTKP